MAKLMALMCLAAWLMAALIASVTATIPRDHFDGSKGLEKIKEIEAIDRNQRSQEQWEELTEGYVEMFLDTDGANKMSIDEVVRAFDNLIGASAHIRGLINFPKSWRILRNLRADLGPVHKQDDCNKGKIASIARLAEENRRCPWQLNYVLGCFRDYLEKCGYEKTHKEAVESMEDTDLNLIKYPTLDSYFRGEVWTDLSQRTQARSNEIAWTIEILEDIAAWERAGSKIVCKFDVYLSNLKKLTEVRFHYWRLLKLAKYRARLYARKCDLEEYCEKEIGRMEAFSYNSIRSQGPIMVHLD